MVNRGTIEIGDLLPQFGIERTYHHQKVTWISYGVVVGFTKTDVPRTIFISSTQEYSFDDITHSIYKMKANISVASFSTTTTPIKYKKVGVNSYMNFSPFPLTEEQKSQYLRDSPIAEKNYNQILSFIEHENSKTLQSRQKKTIDFGW